MASLVKAINRTFLKKNIYSTSIGDAIRCQNVYTTAHVLKRNDAIMQRWERKTERYMKKSIAKLAGLKVPKTQNKSISKRNAVDFQIESATTHMAALAHEFAPQPSSKKQKRARAVSAVMFEHISDLLHSGEISPKLIELGFEVSKVVVPTGLGAIIIHWYATGPEKDDQIEAILEEVGSKIRAALGYLRIIGSVPPLAFKKDYSLGHGNLIESLLEKADYGPDYERTYGTDLLGDPAERGSDYTDDEQSYDDYSGVGTEEGNSLRIPSADVCDETYDAIMKQYAGKINWKNDLYGIDHKDLSEQILRKGTKIKERMERPVEVPLGSYTRENKETLDNITSGKLAELRKKKAVKEPSRTNLKNTVLHPSAVSDFSSRDDISYPEELDSDEFDEDGFDYDEDDRINR